MMAIVLSVCYGFQYRIDAQEAFSYFLSFSGIFVLFLGFVTYNLFAGGQEALRLGTPNEWTGFLMMAASFTLTLFFQSKLLEPMPWYVLAAAAGLASLYVQFNWGAKGGTRFFAIAGLAFVAFVIFKTEIWQKGDMLLVIEAAGKELLAAEQPYRTYPEVYTYLAEKQPSEVTDPEAFANRYYNSKTPLIYLPGAWLAYLPAAAVGIDLRILNLVFLVFIAIVAEKLLPFEESRHVVLSLTLYPVMLSPSFLGILPALHVLPYWLLLLLTMLCIQRERYWLAAALFGSSLATRQPAIFLVGPLFAYLSVQLKWKDLLRYSSVALGVYLLATVPFAAWWGWDWTFYWRFWTQLYLSLTSLSGDFLVGKQVGIASLLAWAGLERSSYLVQLGLLSFAATYVVVTKRRDLSWAMQFLGATYIWCVLFNPYAVRYTYYAGFLLLLSGLAMALNNSKNLTSRRHRAESGNGEARVL
jgi:hypothetical protein